MDLYKIFLPVLLLLAACQQQPEPLVTEIENATSMTADETLEFLNSAEYEQLNLPFSEAVRVGNVLYMSGQIGIVPGVIELVSGGAAAETRQTLENIKATVERYGSSMDRVFKCTVFMADNTSVRNPFGNRSFFGVVNRIGMTGNAIRLVKFKPLGNFIAPMHALAIGIVDWFVAEILTGCRVFNRMAFGITTDTCLYFSMG